MSLNVEHAPARPRTAAPDIKALVLKLRGKSRKNDTKWIVQLLCDRLHGDDDLLESTAQFAVENVLRQEETATRIRRLAEPTARKRHRDASAAFLREWPPTAPAHPWPSQGLAMAVHE
jgi:hypothetical protein